MLADASLVLIETPLARIANPLQSQLQSIPRLATVETHRVTSEIGRMIHTPTGCFLVNMTPSAPSRNRLPVAPSNLAARLPLSTRFRTRQIFAPA